MSCLSHKTASCASGAESLRDNSPVLPQNAESYAVFPGITLVYNRFDDCDTGCLPGGGDGILVIDHCRDGRVEYAADGALCFLADGDLFDFAAGRACARCVFPTAAL